VVVSLHGVSASATRNYGISASSRTFIERLRTRTKVVLAVFGSPYSLKYFDQFDHVVCAYEDNDMTRGWCPRPSSGPFPPTAACP
jgi:hypothetical protein